MKKSLRTLLFVFLIGISIIGIVSLGCWLDVHSWPDSCVSVSESPNGDCIVIPATGTHTAIAPKMKARLDAGYALYRAGKADTIILTGRDREPEMLRDYLLELGCPEDALVLDPSGIDFLHSMKYLGQRGGRALFCVEPLHTARARYLAAAQGADIVCILASNNRPDLIQLIREYLAASKAVLEVRVLHR